MKNEAPGLRHNSKVAPTDLQAPWTEEKNQNACWFNARKLRMDSSTNSSPIPSLSQGMLERVIRVKRADIVLLRSIFEGYEGLSAWYAEPAKDEIRLYATPDFAQELDELLSELQEFHTTS